MGFKHLLLTAAEVTYLPVGGMPWYHGKLTLIANWKMAQLK
jgi:hypothetical protein